MPAAGGNGAVCFAQVVDRHCEWANLTAQVFAHDSLPLPFSFRIPLSFAHGTHACTLYFPPLWLITMNSAVDFVSVSVSSLSLSLSHTIFTLMVSFYFRFINHAHFCLCSAISPPSPVPQLDEHNHVLIRDVLNEAGAVVEQLEFGDRVIDMSMGHGHLIVATARQCYVYATQNFATPHIFDVRGSVSLILQSDRYFLLVDSVKGLNVHTYEGRLVCAPKIPGLLPEQLKPGNVALSPDTLAIVDRAKPGTVHMVDVASGRAGDPIKHALEVRSGRENKRGILCEIGWIIFITINHHPQHHREIYDTNTFIVMFIVIITILRARLRMMNIRPMHPLR